MKPAKHTPDPAPDDAKQLRDFISGLSVRATPEEVDAVQVFARRLVEDYDYPKADIQTRPQFRIRKRPSDEEKTYPVDIAVFRSNKKIEDNLFLIVECKKKNRKEGVAQLKLYLDMSPAEVGVWFNGDEHLYLWKVHHRDGSRTYTELPNIPRKNQRIEDVGLYKRKELKPPSNLKAVFRDLRNHLAGMTTGITRDETLAQEIINILFCKIYDEHETTPDETVTFRAGIGEAPEVVHERISKLFEAVKSKAYGDVFAPEAVLRLDAQSLAYVVGELQNYCVTEADRDAIGDAFEVFIGPALRGSEGQFFTPRNVVKMIVDVLAPEPGETIIDPACGSGGFLITSLEYIWRKQAAEAKRHRWTERQLAKREVDVATDCFRGIDKDQFLATVCKAYMALIGDGRGGVFCQNGLLPPSDWSALMQSRLRLGSFDVVVTNPPFGSKIPIRGAHILSQFKFGFRWKKNKKTGVPEQTQELLEECPPQILFLERCIQLLKPGGRLGIVLPESILGNPSYDYITGHLRATTEILGVVTMPEALFKTSGKGGTHTKVCVLFLKKNKPVKRYPIFMADVKWCGHDSRGNPTRRKDTDGKFYVLDEVPLVPSRFRAASNTQRVAGDHLGFWLRSDDVKNNILVPKYYDPEIEQRLLHLKKTHNLVRIDSLVERGVLSLTTGTEVGKMAYGTGNIPFIRTSDLSNWEIKADFKHGVSEEIYRSAQGSVDVQAGDILMVRDGTYLIGTSAIVTESDVPMLFQSHLFRIRIDKPEELSPWLFFACLNTAIVKKQIKSKQFTQDIIDTLGRRVLEIVIPIPKDERECGRIAAETKTIIETRNALRNRAKALALEVEGIDQPDDEAKALLEDI